MYVETSVIGYLASRPQRDVVVAAHQYATRTWWGRIGNQFTPYISQLVVRECSAGDEFAAAERLAFLESIPLLPGSIDAVTLAHALVDRSAVPASEPNDAMHIAMAAVHQVEYLVSWNFRHIVNRSLRTLIEGVCRTLGHCPPTICTPEDLLEMRHDR